MNTNLSNDDKNQSENNENLMNDKEYNESLRIVTSYDNFIKSEKIPKRKYPQQSELPETITILKDDTTDGIVYLVGTAHFRFLSFFFLLFLLNFSLNFFSEKSQREVAEVCLVIYFINNYFIFYLKKNQDN